MLDSCDSFSDDSIGMETLMELGDSSSKWQVPDRKGSLCGPFIQVSPAHPEVRTNERLRVTPLYYLQDAQVHFWVRF